ncbi:MAG: hypothetical protein O3B01_27350 [Planctomycetota bacterium]|nr:hypothetical protein [Planctomycetota bacterium]
MRNKLKVAASCAVFMVVLFVRQRSAEIAVETSIPEVTRKPAGAVIGTIIDIPMPSNTLMMADDTSDPP